MVERADARIDGLACLISDLLSLSRIGQAGKDEDVELVALAPFVHEALDVQREAMAAREVNGELDLAADLPQVLIADDDLRLVVNNLVGNAVKYNRDGGSDMVTAAVAKGRRRR
jgi:signal transduction histidine kinase